MFSLLGALAGTPNGLDGLLAELLAASGADCIAACSKLPARVAEIGVLRGEASGQMSESFVNRSWEDQFHKSQSNFFNVFLLCQFSEWTLGW